jgi:hypothetical protein
MIKRKLFAIPGSLLGLVLGLAASHGAIAADAICFVPGGSGGSDFIHEEAPKKLAKDHVLFVPFKNGTQGTVQQRAQVFMGLVSKKLAKDPDFRCHLATSSYGGYVARYAYSHLTVQHPTQGTIPFAKIVLSITALQSINYGVPGLEARAKMVNGVPNEEMELSVDYAKHFNSPTFPETYSPWPTTIPVYSVRTFSPNRNEAIRLEHYFLYPLLTKALVARGLNPEHDGIAPLQTQNAGFTLADLHLPHGFFNWESKRTPLYILDFYRAFWFYLQNQNARGLQMFRDTMKAAGVYREPDPATLGVPNY